MEKINISAPAILYKKRPTFTTCPMECVNDPDVSLKAMGLYCYFDSKPDGWQFYVTEILTNVPDGRDSIASAMKNLIDTGWLTREKIRGERGRFVYNYMLHMWQNKPQDVPQA